MACAFCATWIFGINVAFIILAAGLAGAVWTAVQKRKEASA